VGPFGLGDRTFNNDMVNLAIVISALPFGFESVLVPLVMVSMVQWVGKFSGCCVGSCACCEVEVVVGFAQL
jgi:hypothetical protein